MDSGNIFSKVAAFFKEVKAEMKKINWPTKDETIKYTLIVIGVSVAVATYLGGLDFIVETILKKFIF